MRRNALDGGEHVLHLTGKNVRAPHDQHIVRAGTHLGHSRVRAPAGAGRGEDARQVVRPVAQHRKRFLVEQGQHQFALLPFRQDFARGGVDDFPQEMIFGDVLMLA